MSWEDTSSEDTGYASHSEMADADESIIANIICPRCGQGGFLSERNLRRHIERRGIFVYIFGFTVMMYFTQEKGAWLAFVALHHVDGDLQSA